MACIDLLAEHYLHGPGASIIRWRTLARRASEGALDSAQVFRLRCGFWPNPSEIHRYSRRVRLNHPRWRVGLVWLDASILRNLTIKARAG